MRTALAILLSAVLLVGAVAPVTAVPGVAGGGDANASTSGATSAVAVQQANNTTNDSEATVGQQLSTVVSVTSLEVQSDVEETAFSIAVTTENESEAAEAIAERAEELRERAEDIRDAYREATEAYQEGDLTKSQYAQRIAVLNARATDLLADVDTLRQRAKNVSGLELRATGFNATALTQAVRNVDNVTGAGPSALLKRFTGESEGEFEIETANGLSVEVSSEDGEISREVQRPRDADDAMTVNQTVALDSARASLSQVNGTWTLVEASVHSDSGYYKFEFQLESNTSTGEAEVRVDGSTGDVFRIEEELERSPREGERDDERDRDEDEDEREREDGADGEFTLLLASGTPAPNATVTVRAVAGGQPVANATVTLNGERVGTTDATGAVTVTLPASESATLVVTKNDREAELEFEFEERADVYERLSIDASVSNGTVTVTATYDDHPVTNATVYANGERVGTTGADGTLGFAVNATTTLTLELVKGEFTAQTTYAFTDGGLEQTEGPHSDDDDERDEDERDDDSETDSEDERDEEETTTTDDDDEEDEEETTTETEDEEDDEDEDTTTTGDA